MAHWYEALESFLSLDGWSRDTVFVGDSLDARIANFFLKANVKSGWPSKHLIRFDNGEIFDTRSRTFRGKPAFLFLYSEKLHHLFRRRQAEDEIRSYAQECSPGDKRAITRIVVEIANPLKKRFYLDDEFFASLAFDQALDDLSLADLESIVALITWRRAA